MGARIMIDRIEIKNFRGVRRFSSDFSRNNVFIFGENGKGKSSIIEAIEWALTGKVSSLMGIQGISLDKHGHHILSNNDEKDVLIEFNDGSILKSDTRPVKNSQADRICNSARSGINILRRSQLLNAICTQPKSRYELLKPFLPLDTITKIETAASKLVMDYECKLNSLKSKLSDQRGKIANYLDLDTETTINSKLVINRINTLCEEIGLPNIQKLNELTLLKSRLEERTKTAQNLEDLGLNHKVLLQLKNLLNKSEFDKMCTLVKNSHFNYREANIKKDKLFNEAVLSQGLNLIKSGNLSICPLCLNEIDRIKVLKNIERRLNNEKDYTQI